MKFCVEGRRPAGKGNEVLASTAVEDCCALKRHVHTELHGVDTNILLCL